MTPTSTGGGPLPDGLVEKWESMVARVGVIGAGRIATPVIAYLRSSTEWTLSSILVRNAAEAAPADATDDPDVFFASRPDLILDVAGPEALRRHGERALTHADLWTISGSALADADLFRRLEEIGHRCSHRLRLLSGAIAGLAGAATAASDPQARIRVIVSKPRAADGPPLSFRGSAREAASCFPDEVNVAVAAAIASVGLDATLVEHDDQAAGNEYVIGLTAEARAGSVTVTSRIRRSAGRDGNWVASSIIAALRRERSIIWAG